ncbi:PQQ-binding-like beta-propeller repeat protein [Planctomycetota bacterium]
MNVKRVLKRIGIVLAISLPFLGVALYFAWDWAAGYGEDMSNANLEIPSPAANPPPLESGLTDWPQWKGPSNDNRSLVKNIRTDWSEGLPKLWEIEYLCQDTPSVAWSCPVVQGNRLVVQGRSKNQDHVFALDPIAGTLIWHQLFESTSGGDSYGEGPRSAPTIDDNRVYTVTRGGDVSCWDLLDGKLRWRKNLPILGGAIPNWGYAASPVVDGDTLLIPAGGQSLLLGFNKHSGDILWQAAPGPCSYSTPVVTELQGRKQIVYLGGQALFGLDPNNGTELWQTPWVTGNNINICTPIIDENIVVISAGYGKGMKVVKVTDRGPEDLWQGKQIQAHLADPFVLDGYIYGYSGMSVHNRGTFKCIDLKTGDEHWETKAIGTGSFIHCDPYFVCLDLKGNLFLVEPNEKTFTLVTQFPKAIDRVRHRSWTKPILANDRLYLRFVHRLICYEIKR